MIIRIVQMNFRQDCIPVFLALFEERKTQIRQFNGCSHLELWQDTQHPNLIFTYSMWESEKALDHYRYSELFKDTWSLTKQLFAAKAQAWSINRLVALP
jgi:quinol monooxygenase YgiN